MLLEDRDTKFHIHIFLHGLSVTSIFQKSVPAMCLWGNYPLFQILDMEAVIAGVSVHIG